MCASFVRFPQISPIEIHVQCLAGFRVFSSPYERPSYISSVSIWAFCMWSSQHSPPWWVIPLVCPAASPTRQLVLAGRPTNF